MTAHRANATLGRASKIVVFLLALAAFSAPRPLDAQGRGGTVLASTTLLPPPVTGTGLQELKFGSVRPGDVVDVPPGPAAGGATTSAAGWLFGNIRKGHLVRIDLTLPPELARGGDSAPIDWSNAGYGTLCVAKSGGTACQVSSSFNPGADPSQSLSLAKSLSGNNFDVILYAGARMTIPPAITPGLYTASVTAVFTYLN